MGRQSDTAVEEELIYTIRTEDFAVNFYIHPRMRGIIDIKKTTPSKHYYILI
jgi:hypothetical protein